MGLYLLLINIITFALYAIDKLNAKNDSWRISERMLILFAIAGGSVGALLGMYICRHKTRKPKFKIGIPVILLMQIGIMMFALAACGSQTIDSADTVKYNGQKYVYLEYPANVFYYDYNGSSHDNFEEADGIYPIDSPQWEMIWNGGDLYCIEDRVEEAHEYYADDENYTWYYLIDSDEEDNEINALPITVTASELEVVYDVENQEKDFALFFEEFDALGSLFKISKDGIVRGTLSIGKYEDTWYWRSEVIDDSRERDGTWPEYVQPLPQSLSSKMNEAE